MVEWVGVGRGGGGRLGGGGVGVGGDGVGWVVLYRVVEGWWVV